MSYYRVLISRILVVLANLVMLAFGILCIIAVFSNKTSSIGFGEVLAAILGIAIGGVSIVGAVFGLKSAFVEYELIFLNYIGPVMNALVAAACIYIASTQNPTTVPCVLFVSMAGILILGAIGAAIIFISEARVSFDD